MADSGHDRVWLGEALAPTSGGRAQAFPLKLTVPPVLFDDTEPEVAQRLRTSIVAPAQRSPSAQRKAQSKKTPDGLPAHSFQTLIQALATLTRNRIQPTLPNTPSFQTLTRPSPLQQKVLSLLGITLRV